MSKKGFIIIVSENTPYRKGTVIKDFHYTENGVIFEGIQISKNNYRVLNEKLSSEDEKQVKELIRNQFKYLFWNLYTKQSSLLSN